MNASFSLKLDYSLVVREWLFFDESTKQLLLRENLKIHHKDKSALSPFLLQGFELNAFDSWVACEAAKREGYMLILLHTPQNTRPSDDVPPSIQNSRAGSEKSSEMMKAAAIKSLTALPAWSHVFSHFFSPGSFSSITVDLPLESLKNASNTISLFEKRCRLVTTIEDSCGVGSGEEEGPSSSGRSSNEKISDSSLRATEALVVSWLAASSGMTVEEGGPSPSTKADVPGGEPEKQPLPTGGPRCSARRTLHMPVLVGWAASAEDVALKALLVGSEQSSGIDGVAWWRPGLRFPLSFMEIGTHVLERVVLPMLRQPRASQEGEAQLWTLFRLRDSFLKQYGRANEALAEARGFDTDVMGEMWNAERFMQYIFLPHLFTSLPRLYDRGESIVLEKAAKKRPSERPSHSSPTFHTWMGTATTETLLLVHDPQFVHRVLLPLMAHYATLCGFLLNSEGEETQKEAKNRCSGKGIGIFDPQAWKQVLAGPPPQQPAVVVVQQRSREDRCSASTAWVAAFDVASVVEHLQAWKQRSRGVGKEPVERSALGRASPSSPLFRRCSWWSASNGKKSTPFQTQRGRVVGIVPLYSFFLWASHAPDFFLSLPCGKEVGRTSCGASMLPCCLPRDPYERLWTSKDYLRCLRYLAEFPSYFQIANGGGKTVLFQYVEGVEYDA